MTAGGIDMPVTLAMMITGKHVIVWISSATQGLKVRRYVKIDSPGVLARRMEYAAGIVRDYLTAGPVVLTISEETRNLDQNAKMWAMLGDVSKQVVWHDRRLSPDDWKHVFSASLHGQDAVPGIDGGFVVMGKSTSRMTKRQMSDVIELMYAFGSERGVEWSGPFAHEKM